MASSSATDFTHIFRDDFASRQNEERKIKRGNWHKRRGTASPTDVPDLESPENPKKRTKLESALTVKFEPLPPVAAPLVVKKEKDSDGDDALMAHLGLNPLVHTPKCQHCGAENSLQENDETALVCTTCAHVNSKPELRRGFDTPMISKKTARAQDQHAQREVSVKPLRV